MKKVTTYCDLCEKEIVSVDGKAFTLNPGRNLKRKIGHDIVLTPRGDRMYTHSEVNVRRCKLNETGRT